VKNYSILLLGPSGSGKSSFIRGMLKHYGSGAVAMAPGWDEKNSYTELLEDSSFRFQGFDDYDFQPMLGVWELQALPGLVKWLNAVRDEVMADVAEGKAPRYKVLALDTVSAMSRFAVNATMKQMKLLVPPAARSPEGAAYYQLLRQAQEAMFRPVRAIYGAGVNVVAAAHVTESETVNEAQVAEKGAKMIVPDVAGGFKTVLPSFFDLVVHSMVMKVGGQSKHMLQWKPDMKRPTKSRLGGLGDGTIMPNEFEEVLKRLEAAAEHRAK
jgi:hypothetical protein